MRNKGLGFICIGHEGKFFFFNKKTGKIVIAQNIGRAEYLPKKAVRLKETFPLKQSSREELIMKIREEYASLIQKT